MLYTNMEEYAKKTYAKYAAPIGHRLEACLKFRSKTSTDRVKDCAKFGHSFRCLGLDHFSLSCKKNTTCSVEGYGKRHHTLIHGAELVAKRIFGAQGMNNSTIFIGSVCLSSASKSILIAIVPIVAESKEREYLTFVLLDPGSTATIITNHRADKLGLSGRMYHLVRLEVQKKWRQK